MYKIEVNKDKKAFVVVVDGFFKIEDGMAFLEDYNKKLASINPREYNFAICGKGLKTSLKDAVAILDNCIKLYMSSSFKKYYAVMPDSPTCNMQVRQVLKENKLEMTNKPSIEDILSEL